MRIFMLFLCLSLVYLSHRLGLVEGTGQGDNESAAASGLAAQLNSAAMELRQRPRNRESETGAGGTARFVGVESVEALKHQALIARTDAWAVVSDFQSHGSVRSPVDQ